LETASIYEFNNGEFTSTTGKHSNEETLKSIQHLLPTDKSFRIAINSKDEPISLPATDGYTEPYKNPAEGVEHNACMKNHAASDNHGFWIAPATMTWQNKLLPVFSQSKLDCFADILLPLAYHQSSSNDDIHLIPFGSKKPVLFWRGSTTVFRNSSNLNWRKSHRIRLIQWGKEIKNQT
jgi:hypothetical protein